MILDPDPSHVVAIQGTAVALALSSSVTDVETPAVIAEVLDTVGDDDTCDAGFLAGLSRQIVLYAILGLEGTPTMDRILSAEEAEKAKLRSTGRVPSTLACSAVRHIARRCRRKGA